MCSPLLALAVLVPHLPWLTPTHSTVGASTETAVALTVEWLGSQSDFIACGRAVHVTALPRVLHSDPTDGLRPDVTLVRFELTEVIKGPMAAGDTISVWSTGKTWDGVSKQQATGIEQLVFGRIATSADAFGEQELEGKYTLTEAREFQSVYGLKAKVDRLYSPTFERVATAAEVRQRARRWAEWERTIQRRHPEGGWTHSLLEVPAILPMHAGLAGGSAVYLSVPKFLGTKSYGPVPNILLETYPQASFEHLDSDAPSGTLMPGGIAFSNRLYVWGALPDALVGWSFTSRRGGEPSPIHLRATSRGFLFAAIESKSSAVLEQAGWKRAGYPSNASFYYTDRGRTKMAVHVREVDAGDMVEVPQIGWTGTMLMAPPLTSPAFE